MSVCVSLCVFVCVSFLKRDFWLYGVCLCWPARDRETKSEVMGQRWVWGGWAMPQSLLSGFWAHTYARHDFYANWSGPRTVVVYSTHPRPSGSRSAHTQSRGATLREHKYPSHPPTAKGCMTPEQADTDLGARETQAGETKARSAPCLRPAKALA